MRPEALQFDKPCPRSGHSCVKGRFAYGYATHQVRILKPMIRDTIGEAWREVSWAEAMKLVAVRKWGIQSKYGRNSVGVITSSRCMDEERRPHQFFPAESCGNGPDPREPP